MLVLALVSVALLVAGAMAGMADERASTIPAGVEARLIASALSRAREAGDVHPYDIWMARISSTEASRLEGLAAHEAGSPGREVYLVAMRGRFVCGGCTTPLGVGVPRGTVITLQFPVAADGAFISTFGLGRRYPRLASVRGAIHLYAAPRVGLHVRGKAREDWLRAAR